MSLAPGKISIVSPLRTQFPRKPEITAKESNVSYSSVKKINQTKNAYLSNGSIFYLFTQVDSALKRKKLRNAPKTWKHH
jgi:hypothetical protein